MKAVVKTRAGKGNIALKELAIPSPASGEVMISVKAVGVCGTDVHILHGTYATTTPLVIGHEFSGEIVKLGAGVARWAVGDRVVVENTYGACGVCAVCRTGNPHVCPEKRAYGTDSNGAMADFACFPAAALHRIPVNVSYEEAAVVEPLAVVNRGVLERGDMRSEANVVVLGPGPIGLLAVQVCKAAGANRVLLAGTGKDAEVRLPLGSKFGADRIVNVEREDLSAAVKEMTAGEGADLVVEASGSPRAAQDAIHIAGRGKIVAVIGLACRPVSLNWDLAVFKEIDLRFAKSSTYMSWRRALTMISSGRVNVKDMITHRFALHEWRKALMAVETGQAVKAVIIPSLGRSVESSA